MHGEPRQDPARWSNRDVFALVEAAQRGDAAACSTLYNLHVNRVFGHLVTLLGSDSDVEDATQEVFLHAFRNLGKFTFQSKFSTWLHGIAVRVALNKRRSLRRRGRAGDEMTRASESGQLPRSGRRTTAEPERRLFVKERASQLYGYLERMSERKRTAFLLHHVEMLSVEEVAIRTGASKNTTAARIKQARKELRRQIERSRRSEEAR